MSTPQPLPNLNRSQTPTPRSLPGGSLPGTPSRTHPQAQGHPQSPAQMQARLQAQAQAGGRPLPNGHPSAAGNPQHPAAAPGTARPPPPLQRPKPRPAARTGSGLFTGKKKAIDEVARIPVPAITGGVGGSMSNAMDVDGPVGMSQGRGGSPAAGGLSRGSTPVPGGMGSAIPGRLLPGNVAGQGGRSSPGPGAAPAISRTGSAQGMVGMGSPRLRPQQDGNGSAAAGSAGRQNVLEYPLFICSNEATQNPAYETDPVLRSLPFPTAFNILTLHHPSSSSLPLPDLSNEHTLLYLNHKDLSAAPPPDPEIARQKALDNELKDQIRKPIKKDGKWQARTWDPKTKGALKNPQGGEIWKDVADPALVAPLPTHLLSSHKMDGGRKKSKRGGRGGARGGRGGGGRGGGGDDGDSKHFQYKYRPEPVMLRGRGKQRQYDLPSSSEEEVEVDKEGNIYRPNEKRPGRDVKTSFVKMAKSHRKRIAYNNGLNREKLPMVLEGEFAPDRTVVEMPPPPVASNTTTTTSTARAGSTPNSPNPYARANIKPQIDPATGDIDPSTTMAARTTFVPINYELRPPARYHGHQLTAADGGSGAGGYTTIALCFHGATVGVKFVGREYKMNILRERPPREGRGGAAATVDMTQEEALRSINDAPSASDQKPKLEADGNVAMEIDDELYRTTPSISAQQDVKPNIKSEPRPPAGANATNSRRANNASRGGGDDRDRRGRGTDQKPITGAGGSIVDKLNRFERSDYAYARAGTGKDVDEDAMRAARGRGKAAGPKWEDDEMRGRRGTTGRQNVERGEGEDLDYENNDFQDDEEEVVLGADDEEATKERQEVLDREYANANANVGLLQRDDIDEDDGSDSDDLFGEKAEARAKARKRQRRLKKQFRGDDADMSDVSDNGDSDDDDEDDSEIESVHDEEEKDVKPDINSLNGSPKEKASGTGRSASPSPATSRVRIASPAPRRDGSPGGSSVRNVSLERGAGHALSAHRALSPNPSAPGGQNNKKRKGGPVRHTAPPTAGGSSSDVDRSSPGPNKKQRVSADAPGNRPRDTSVGPDIKPPVVEGTGGPATLAAGHARLKVHKNRGKKKAVGQAGGPARPEGTAQNSQNASKASTPGPSGGSASSGSRQNSPAPGNKRSGSANPHSKRASPALERVTPAQLQDLKDAPFPNAITYDYVVRYLQNFGGPVVLQNFINENPNYFGGADNARNRDRLKLLRSLFMHDNDPTMWSLQKHKARQ